MSLEGVVAVIPLKMSVIGVEKLALRINSVRAKTMKMRTVGVSRAGSFLLVEKKDKCKQQLYGGQEVAPNKYRYGWQYLGGPAIYHFQKYVYNAHRKGKVMHSGNTDSVDVVLDTALARHAGLIHGPTRGGAYGFFNPRLQQMVKYRYWMRADIDELRMCMVVLIKAYKGT